MYLYMLESDAAAFILKLVTLNVILNCRQNPEAKFAEFMLQNKPRPGLNFVSFVYTYRFKSLTALPWLCVTRHEMDV